MKARCAGIASVVMPLFLLGAAAPQPSPGQPTPKRWSVPIHLEAEIENGEPVGNVSGLACAGSRKGQRDCLIIDDELTFAQRARIGGGVITAGAKVELVGAGPAVGTAPNLTCDDAKKPKDLDGEGVAAAGGTFYVIGSHGCGRSQGAVRSSSFLIARVLPTGEVRTSYRVSEALQSLPEIKAYFGKRLEDTKARAADGDKPAVPARSDENGLNIEGLAVSDGRLWIGLRGPVVNCTAYLVTMNAAAVFDSGQQLDARAEPLSLGADHGVRDLAPLSDGRLLVLSGPRTNAGQGYGIRVYDPRSRAAPVAIYDFQPADLSGKPEGLLVLGEKSGSANLLVVQDGPVDGDPREIVVRIPARASAAAPGGAAIAPSFPDTTKQD